MGNSMERSNIDQKCDFSFAHYISTLKNYQKSYTFSSYSDCSDNDIILRHDVDFSLEDALMIAEIENKLGIRSTFFILLHSELYNPLGYISSKLVTKILNLGHRIGLHYDELFFEQTNTNLSEGIEKELNLLNQHFNTNIESVVRHNPSIRGNKVSLRLPDGIIDAMSEKFIVERKYLSDSVQFWREGCFCQYPTKFTKFQILTHPSLWTNEGLSRSKILPKISDRFIESHQNLIQGYSTIWTEYIKQRLIEKN